MQDIFSFQQALSKLWIIICDYRYRANAFKVTENSGFSIQAILVIW